MAFQQRAWMVVRHKMARLDTADSIFTTNTNIFSLFSWSSIKKAKVGSLLALYCWVTPLVVVLTSETLSVVNGNAEELVQCPSVRTLNFDNEASNNWRGVNVNDTKFVSHYNTTSRSTKPEDFNSTHFDYWTGPNTRYISLVANKAIFMREPLFRDESAAEELASGVGAKVKDLGYSKAPRNTSSIAPEGNLTYPAWVAQEAYAIPRGAGGPRPKDLGIFQNESIIYAKVEDMDAKYPTS
ncbi:uncharacterized protein FTOL_07442 [Fusarium torulosum]|uniref:Uncharacterized protein n=1 Tax=Fusarium torulosum TaxID=33205 RepID=A0AAE8MD79_9HYPO|nr:uncharacterized protein FTOL_07442 [Fusarium torulosum]